MRIIFKCPICGSERLLKATEIPHEAPVCECLCDMAVKEIKYVKEGE